MNTVDMMRQILGLCDPMDAKFDKIREICNNFINCSHKVVDNENVNTVEELIRALDKMPKDAKVCGSRYMEKHDEYDCEVRSFRVAHYNDGSDDGLVYVGIDYKHPN